MSSTSGRRRKISDHRGDRRLSPQDVGWKTRVVVAVNPTVGLDLPANRSKRAEIVAPEHAAALIDALGSEGHRGLWATAFYAGLHRGESMGLRWCDVDLEANELHVERSYDPKSQTFVVPKSRAGRRRVPIAAVLGRRLLALKIASRRPGPEALVFGDTPSRPFGYIPMLNRTRAAWKEAKLAPIGLHAARHTAASVMIAAGVNVKALSTFMGHSSITITLDLVVRRSAVLPSAYDAAPDCLVTVLEQQVMDPRERLSLRRTLEVCRDQGFESCVTPRLAARSCSISQGDFRILIGSSKEPPSRYSTSWSASRIKRRSARTFAARSRPSPADRQRSERRRAA